MSLVIEALAHLTLLLNIAILGGLTVLGLERFTSLNIREFLRLQQIEDKLQIYYRETAFVLALTATSGSLYMSEIMEWTPCRLCWYQRIFMYPLTFITATALVTDKHDVSDYVLPLSMIGSGISIYHYMIERIDQFDSAGCSIYEVSCSTTHTFHFGYITVSFMAFTAFIAITLLMWRYSKN